MEKTRCDFVVGILNELRTEVMEATPYFLLENNWARIVCTLVFLLNEFRDASPNRGQGGKVPTEGAS